MGKVEKTVFIHETSSYIFERSIEEAVGKLQRLNLVVDPINVSTTEKNNSVYFTVIVVGRSKE
jgi:hypothetical protein